MRSFGNRMLRASVSSFLDVNSGIMKDWSSFFGDPSDLARGCDFGSKEESIVRDVLIFNMKHEEVRKQLCTDTMNPTDAVGERWCIEVRAKQVSPMETECHWE